MFVPAVRSAVTASILAATLATTAFAGAEQKQPVAAGVAKKEGQQADDGPPVQLAKPKEQDTAQKPLTWNYRRFSAVEYGITGAFLLGAAGTSFVKSSDPNPSWRGGVLMDDSAAGLLRAETAAGRDRAARASDYFLYAMIAFPYLDAGYAAVVRKSPDVAWQMALINTEAFAINGLVTQGIKLATRRERPWVTNTCDPNDPSCHDNNSFLSGHTSMAFTSAGLTCAHHQALGLYGNKVADYGMCALSLAAATTTGLLRIAADKHYASDVLAGAALGLTSGYVLPMLLHYRKGSGIDPTMKDEIAKAKKRGFSVSAAPAPITGPLGSMGVGISVSGIVF